MTTTTAKLKLLTAAEILAADDYVPELVSVPEWGGSVWVCGLSGKGRDDYEISLVKGKVGQSDELNLHNARAKLLVLTMVESDAPGAPRMFTPDQVKALGEKSAGALQRVFRVAQRLSGLSNDDLKELTVDLGKDPSDDSGSD